MARETISLALAFVKAHPETAAATLELHAAEEVAGFLGSIPPSTSNTVLEHLLPHFASRVCAQLSKEHAVLVLSTLKIGPLAAILRYWKRSPRQALLKELPAKTQVACSLLLNYSDDMVGSWTALQVAMLTPDTRVKDALKYLNNTPDLVTSECVYLVSRERELEGRIRFLDLVKAKPDTSVGSLAQPAGETLVARMRLSQAATQPEWKRVHELPVLNRNRKMIGVLRLSDLQRGLDQHNPEEAPMDSIGWNSLVKVYGESLPALFSSLKSIIEAELQSSK